MKKKIGTLRSAQRWRSASLLAHGRRAVEPAGQEAAPLAEA
jgi:hypothetical protein